MESFADIGRTMMIADKYFKLYLRDELKPFDLNTAEGVILLMLLQKARPQPAVIAGKTQDELIRELHYDKGVMTRTMKELEQKGYVLREQNPADSRSFLFSLTEKGRDFRAPLLDILRRWNARLLAGVEQESLAITRAALDQMAQNAAAFYGETHAKKST